MPLRLVYSASPIPCRDETVEAVLSRHVDFKLQDSFRILVPDLESRLDLEHLLLADRRLGEVLIGKSLLTWSSLIQNLLTEMPKARPAPSFALQRRALRLALAESGFDWKLDLDSERRLIRELQQLLRLWGSRPAFPPGARLAQNWRRLLREHFLAWSPEEAAEQVWTALPALPCRDYGELREIFVLGFKSPEPSLRIGIEALLKKFSKVQLHLYLPPRASLIGEEEAWLPWLKALEDCCDCIEEWHAKPPAQRELWNFPTVVHEAGRILAEGFPDDCGLLLPSSGELNSHLEARYFVSLGGELPAPDGSHASLSAELLAALVVNNPEGAVELREILANKSEIFSAFQTRLAACGDREGLKLLEGFLQKLQETLSAESFFPEKKIASEWWREIREDCLSLRIPSTSPSKQLPWRTWHRPGLLSFPKLWIAGLEEGLLPVERAAIYFEEEQAFALSALEEKLSFEQLLRSAGEAIVFSHSEFSLDGRPQTPSPWLDPWISKEAKRAEEKLTLVPRRRSTYWEENLRREAARHRAPPFNLDSGDLSSLDLRTSLQAQMQAKPLSPTYLDKMAKCPWSFFASRHLKLEKSAEEDLEIDPRRRGSLQHRLLESVFAELIRQHFSAGNQPSPAEIEKTLEASYADLARETLKEPGPIPPVLLRDQLERMREAARLILTEEQECWTQAKRKLHPRYLEWGFGRGGTAPLLIEVEAGLQIPLGGKIDRVDLSEDGGSFLIIDYKSSQSDTMASELRAGLSLQLWVYLLAIRQRLFPQAEAIGALYWDLKEGRKSQGLARRDLYKDFSKPKGFRTTSSIVKEETYEELGERLDAKLRALLKRALSGDFSLDPEKCSGSRCDYFEICRYDNKPRN